jgi:hypothetical protein
MDGGLVGDTELRSSVRSRQRRAKASSLARAFRAADKGAAYRLKMRGLALRGLRLWGWEWRVKLMNEAQKRNRDERGKRVNVDQLCRPWRESTGDL